MIPEDEYNQLRDAGRITFDHSGPKIRIWAGWYQHAIILLDGKEAGRIQRKRQFKRESYTTVSGNAAVVGADSRWAVSWHMGR